MKIEVKTRRRKGRGRELIGNSRRRERATSAMRRRATEEERFDGEREKWVEEGVGVGMEKWVRETDS